LVTRYCTVAEPLLGTDTEVGVKGVNVHAGAVMPAVLISKAEKMTACQKRVNLIGAINLDNHDVEYQHVDWVNGESIKAFLNQLLEANPDARQIHLIWDNAGYHRSKEIQAFVANTKINLHFLPPYSPNLNPIERLWKIMHEQVTYNRYYPKFADFTEAILNFFENIELHKNTMLSRITDNFQRLAFT
jgi:transposase